MCVISTSDIFSVLSSGVNLIMKLTISIGQYKKLCEYLSSTHGQVSNNDHFLIIEKMQVIDELFTENLEIRIAHTDCLGCKGIQKECSSSAMIYNLIDQLNSPSK